MEDTLKEMRKLRRDNILVHRRAEATKKRAETEIKSAAERAETEIKSAAETAKQRIWNMLVAAIGETEALQRDGETKQVAQSKKRRRTYLYPHHPPQNFACYQIN